MHMELSNFSAHNLLNKLESLQIHCAPLMKQFFRIDSCLQFLPEVLGVFGGHVVALPPVGCSSTSLQPSNQLPSIRSEDIAVMVPICSASFNFESACKISTTVSWSSSTSSCNSTLIEGCWQYG